jgi:hypothetical protein
MTSRAESDPITPAWRNASGCSLTTIDLGPLSESEALQIALMRDAPAWRKLALVAEMNETVKLLAMSGLRSRYPEAGPAELRRRLADILLGPELAERAYGPLSDYLDDAA